MKVTVLMPVYNTEKYVGEAVESILQQTFSDFEFIIIDDASTDETAERVKDYRDERIVFIQNTDNIGLAASLNKGISVAQGKYIARMDGDDISLPDRLSKQVDFLDSHPEVGVLGSWIELFGRANTVNRYPESDSACKCQLLFGVPFAHPAVVFRKETLLRNKLFYREELLQYGEDYDMWMRASAFTMFHNLPNVLLKYRTYSYTWKKSDQDRRSIQGTKTRNKIIGNAGIELNEHEAKLYALVIKKGVINYKDGVKLSDVESFLLKLLTHNKQNVSFHQKSLEQCVSRQWFYFCYQQNSLKAVKYYFRSFLKSYHYRTLEGIKFVAKPMINSVGKGFIS